MSVSLPNIRKLFLPDPGYTIFDCDLSGADAQVVAWEAEDAPLKEAFRRGLKVHIMNCRDMFSDRVVGWSDEAIKESPLYKQNKQAVHATNYGSSARTLAQILGWTVIETERFQSRWFAAHPGIRAWHRRTELQLRTSRMVTNQFGYRRVYFDRIDALLPEALAWVPQSTVALVCFHGALALRRHIPSLQLLVQVHDSLVFQIPSRLVTATLPDVRRLLHTAVPYPDPLTIPWGLAASTKSWGDCEAMKWPEEKKAA